MAKDNRQNTNSEGMEEQKQECTQEHTQEPEAQAESSTEAMADGFSDEEREEYCRNHDCKTCDCRYCDPPDKEAWDQYVYYLRQRFELFHAIADAAKDARETEKNVRFNDMTDDSKMAISLFYFSQFGIIEPGEHRRYEQDSNKLADMVTVSAIYVLYNNREMSDEEITRIQAETDITKGIRCLALYSILLGIHRSNTPWDNGYIGITDPIKAIDRFNALLHSFIEWCKKSDIDPNETGYKYAVTRFITEYKPQKKVHRPNKDQAAQIGAVTTLGNMLLTPSDNDLFFAFTGLNIKRLPDTLQECTFDHSGKLDLMKLNNRQMESITQIHLGLLAAMFRAVVIEQERALEPTTKIKLYLPSIARELQIDGREKADKRTKIDNNTSEFAAKRANHVKQLAAPFDNLVGRMPNGAFYRVLAFESYDPATDVMVFSAPYLFKIAEQRDSKYNWLFHANAANEHNWAAMEVADRILKGVLQRGTKTADANGKKFITYQCTFKLIIDDCPQLKAQLAEVENAIALDKQGNPITDSNGNTTPSKNKSQLRNNILKNVFTAAYRIIMEKSEAPHYYKDFSIIAPIGKDRRPAAPTNSRLSDRLIIRHYGRNPGYQDSRQVSTD